MIEVTTVSRHYGKIAAVDHVSFAIGNNEVVGLLGHNGAGKTTLMRMLSGYLEPSSGAIKFEGKDLWQDIYQVQHQLGYLPENLPVYPDMMVADYLEYAATLKGIPRRDRMSAVREALLATDLASRALETVSALSRGLKQRVGVAQAIVGHPRLLILDEPTNGLDPRQTEHMRQLIRRLARRATVILSTHIMEEVNATCDRVLILRDGQLALDQPLDELRDSRSLQLRASSGDDDLAERLGQLEQIAEVIPGPDQDGTRQYTLLLHREADLDQASGSVARCVQSVQANLFGLQPMVRDLGKVFQEVNNRGE